MAAASIIASVITGGSNSHQSVSEEFNAYATDFVSQGVVGSVGANVGSGGTGSFCVNADASPDMGVTVKAGQAYVSGTPSSQSAQVIRARMSSDYTTYTINANTSGSTKYDWIYLSLSATNANTPSASADNVITLLTSRSSSNSADNGSPPTYGLLLAVVTVANGASSITNSNIQDRRTGATIGSTSNATSTGWNTGLTTPSTVTANGNRSYSLVFNGTDLTGTLSPGMRLRTTRTVAAPTQCTSLNGTTQFYSKTSPAGMTFTNNFVVSAWVKLSSYAATDMVVVSRYNGTSGWRLNVSTAGRVDVTGFNAGAANFSQIVSYQSIPLNKWVHIAGQLDMATFTSSPTTSYIMIDGVDVPAQSIRGGTNPTALLQAGNLEIGSTNGGTVPFPGKIAQVAIYNAKVTEANIQATISQGLAGTETSLISAYSFNNSINDLNANANNLTANGSAVATATDSPFGGQAGGAISSTLDYGIITSASFSTNTTAVVQCSEGNTIPTSGGVSAVSYSSVKVPYGFPGQRGKWTISSIARAQSVQTSAAASTWYNLGSQQLNIPIGEWIAGYSSSPISSATSNVITLQSLSTANNTAGDTEFATQGYLATTGTFGSPRYVRRPLSLSAQTPYYLNTLQQSGTSVTLYNTDDTVAVTPSIIEAECAHL